MNGKMKRFNSKKVVTLFIVIIFILLIIYSVSFYRTVEKSKLMNFDVTENLIFNYMAITTISKAYHFQDEKEYHIVYGHDDMDNDWMVFVPLTEKMVTKDELTLI